jgi:hypothetical protein
MPVVECFILFRIQLDYAFGGGIVGAIEQEQLHCRGIFRENGKIDPIAHERRAEWKALAYGRHRRFGRIFEMEMHGFVYSNEY